MEEDLSKSYMNMWNNYKDVELTRITTRKASIEARKTWANTKSDAKKNDIEFIKVWSNVLSQAHKLRAIAMSTPTETSFIYSIRPKGML